MVLKLQACVLTMVGRRCGSVGISLGGLEPGSGVMDPPSPGQDGGQVSMYMC